MKKLFIILAISVLASVALVPTGSASAAEITFVSVVGSWRDPVDNVPGSQPGDPVIVNGDPISSISWGTTSGSQSGYDFIATLPPPFTLPGPIPYFSLGTFQHRNFTIGEPFLVSVELDVVIVLAVDGVPIAPLTFTFTFNHDETPNNLDPCPYPTPPGEGCTDRVQIVASAAPTTFNVGGVDYTLQMSFLDNGSPVDEFITREGDIVNSTGLVGDFTLPPGLTVAKTGPATMRIAEWGDFVIGVQNASESDAHNATIVDRLPDGPTGGMCDTTPEILSAQVFAADGVTPVPGKGPLVQGTDYSLAYNSAACELTFITQTAASVIGVDEILRIAYRTQLDTDSQDGVTLTNVAGATRWFNADGSTEYLRTLTDGSVGVGDHEDAHSVTVTTDNNSLAKAIVADTYVDASSTAGDKTVRIGDIATYRLTLNLGEGTTRSVTVLDGLPAGMAYDSLVSITPASGSGTFTYSLVSQPAAGATGTLVWDLGNVVNAPSNDGTPVDALVIEYKAKVLRDAGIAQTPTTTLTNTATLSYQDAGGNPVVDPTRLVASDTLTLWQPVLSVNKAATPAGGDNIIEAGEAITYTVDIINGGAAPAYDPVLVDTLPLGMRQGGVTTTSVTRVTAGTALPVLAPAYDANTGVATWNFDNGTADTYTIPAGETLRVVYQATADANLGAGLILTNAATATLYYSFDDEAVPTSGSATDRQVYGPTNTATANLTTPRPGTLLKENTQPTAAIGEQFKYRITVPSPPVNTALYDVRILDDLTASAADLRFVSVAKISGSGSWTPVNTGTGTVLVIEDTVNGIDIPAGEQAVVEVTVELLNTPTNVIGLSFTNTADYSYNQVDNTPASQTSGLPGTTAPMQIVGLGSQKTVSIAVDNNSNGLVDPGDVLLYTIAVNNPGPAPATGVVLTDDVPVNTTYVADSVMLNGGPVGQPDGGIPPLASGLAINSAGRVSGTIAAGSSAAVTFRVRVNAGVPAGTVISNQGYVTSNERPTLPTDADGNAANGYQPTTIVVGSAQQVMITKEVFVVGGGAALPGGELEYVVRVINTGTIPTTDLVITDDLTSLAGQATYVAGSATLNGTAAGVSYAPPVLTADYATAYGNLPGFATATLRFRVLIDNGLETGTRLTNTAQMAWNTPTLTATASVYIDIGGEVGSAMLSGRVWHDPNLDKLYGAGETKLEGWTVDLYRNSLRVASVTTNADGLYSFRGLEPTLTADGQYELRFTAPGAGPNTASMGQGDSPFTNGPQRINDIIASSGANLQNLNLPLWPNGTVYNSVVRTTVAGAGVRMLNATTGAALPGQCFDDPVQQDQVTADNGFYKFDLNFSDASCPAGGTYFIEVTPPAAGYMNMPSQVIALPQNNTATTPFPVPSCPGNSLYDAVPATSNYCEATASATPPPSIPPAGIKYYLYLTLSDGTVPGQSQVFNNSIPIDPELNGAVAITKTTSLTSVVRGSLVPYTITATNLYGAPLYALSIVDRFPAGFKYKSGSARLDGMPAEPRINGRELVWENLELQVNQKHTIQLLLVVGSGISEGKFVNRAMVRNTANGALVRNAAVASGAASPGDATATVRVIPDTDFDCTDVIGKVFDDRNLNGRQDSGEEGLFGVRVVTARGLMATSDEYGRFHMTCVAVPDEDRGSNFILKLDERSLPSGYRLTTENPRVQRATRGKMIRFNFGATIHRVVRIDIADGAFEPNTSEIRTQWRPKIAQLLEELKKAPSVLRLSYLGDVEPESLVRERLETLKKIIVDQWEKLNIGYRLTIETEIFWRRGAPVSSGAETWLGQAGAPAEATEMNLPVDQSLTTWVHDPAMIKKDEGDRTEMRERVEKDAKTIKLDNLVPPIHFGSGEAEIPDDYLKLLRDVLDRMRDRANVRLHFVGHTDSLPLRDELIKTYGDNVGLSRERAGTVAEYFQRALKLPPEAISYEGLGDSQPVARNTTEEGRQLNRRVEVQVWYDEISKKKTEKEVIIPREVNRIKVCRTENVCKLRYKEGQSHRARIRNLISPLQYDNGMLSVPKPFLQQVGQAVAHLGGHQNLVIKFIGYTDNLPLEGRDKRIYGDSIGLSKAVARRVSLSVQEELGLSNAAIEIEGKGMSRPVTSNNTEQGRALNRRVEVEFWYDDPLQDLPDEPQPCPGAPGAETVTRVYDSPSGRIDPILFENGKPVIPNGYIDTLRGMMDEIGDKLHVRLRFVGYTSDKRLDRRTAAVYGDDIGLSMARARRAMEAVSEKMGLAAGRAEFDGRGYVQSNDVVNAGFFESDTSRVEVRVVYDELIVRDDYEGVEITPLTREVHPTNPFALNPMRITVDGEPIDDPDRSSSDVQRCTDLALENAQIEFKHDSLKLEPRLNVTAWPETIQYQDSPETGFVENQVNFRLYTNYRSFIERAEVRIFEEEQSVRDTPIAVVEMDADGMARWQPQFESFVAPLHKLKYLVRVDDKKGHFDETRTQPLWVVDHIDPSVAEANLGEKLFAGYGESRIAIHNIPLSGGTVQAYGSAIPEGHEVWMAGYKVPVDDNGRFVAEEILPEGLHTVEVGVLDPSGNGKLYLRDLALKRSDWFTVGIADVTLSENRTNGPAELLAPDKPRYSEHTTLDGRLAFYTDGRFENGWSLKASADTREGPLDEIFSNFMDKSPDSLFRRIDPDYHFPTFGDDSTVEEDAPTNGKFYLRLKKENTYGLWGNFKIGYTENDLAHVDRGLYGANLHIQPLDTTSFGEPRLLLDGFAADPGTVAGRDDFRGTDGSLYFLHRQDILEGSERVRIEVRDKDSGMVIAVKNLTPVLDYDIDYLQGRLVLLQPLPATADDGLLVSTGSIAGNPVFLVVRYEFTPGFDNPNTLDTGGRIHYWFNDHLKLGVTASQDKATDVRSSIRGADLTLRQSSETWIRLETGRTKGPGQLTTNSNDGGFNFAASDPFNNNLVKASAYRIDTSMGFKDLFEHGRGRVTIYLQDLGAGYSAPGLMTATDLTQYGGTADLPVTGRLTARLKMDKQIQVDGLDTEAGELNLDYRIGQHWTLSSGLRGDRREDNSAVVPATQEEGGRTDAVARLQYDSLARWSSYIYSQDTIQKSGNRDENGRTGVGGGLRLTDRFNVTGEVSGGNLGRGGKLGTEYLYTDRTTLYSNYTLENDRTDNGLRARKGNMTSGFRTRYSDSVSAYLEERYTHGDVPTGLMHSTGVDLTPTDHVNLGADLDFGTLKDHQTGADIKRTAAGLNAGYGFERLKIASALEYRVDDTEQPDTRTSRRTTWLLKNSLQYPLSPDGRLIGKFNYAVSNSSMGDYYNGEYTEAVLGYAYRPVHHDRLNALLKYTYFYNLPSVDQVTGSNTPSEYIQRSHIGSIDVMYDLTSRWTVGGKYAYRHGQLAQDRNQPEFFLSRAHLYVLRADWHFVYRWDALFEVRRLELPDAEDRRSGVLVGIYRHLGEYFKVGGGYDFSDFSDDLTQLDYRNQGLFINLIGKY